MPECVVCHYEISKGEKPVVLNGRPYCAECVTVCNRCGRAMIRGTHRIEKARGKGYCPECYEHVLFPVCSSCGKKLTAKRSISRLRSVYCPECIDTPFCPTCGRPLGIRHTMDRSGEKRCLNCRTIRAVTPSKTGKLYARIVSNFLYYFKLYLPAGVPVHLVRFSDMQAAAHGGELRSAGIFVPGAHPNILGNIYIVPYYPEEYFVTVLAHELVHAWQYLNWKRKDYANIELREGMALYLEYEYAKICRYGAEIDGIERMLEENSGLPHIAGFRRLLELEKKKTHDGLIAFFLSI